MSVTDNHPTKVGQRVQEIFTDTRGWVVDISTDRAKVDWDIKPDGVAEEDDAVFPLTALRVVEVIRLDVDHYADPSRSLLVQQVSHPEGLDEDNIDLSRSRYKFTNGAVAVGIDAARIELLKQSCSGWED